MEGKILKSILFIGHHFGSFPVKSLRHLEFTKSSIPLLLSLLYLLFYFAIALQIFLTYIQYFNLKIDKSLISKLISSYLVVIIDFITTILLRSIHVLKCPQIANLLKNIYQLENQLSCSGKRRYLRVSYGFLSIFLFLLVFPLCFTTEYKFFIGVNLILIPSSEIWSWLKVTIIFIFMFLDIITYFFTYVLIFPVSLSLLNVFENFSVQLQKGLSVEENSKDLAIIENQIAIENKTDTYDRHNHNENVKISIKNLYSRVLKSNTTRIQQIQIGSENGPKKIDIIPAQVEFDAENFLKCYHQLKESFNCLNNVIGLLIFFILFESCISLVNKIYLIGSNDGGTDLLDVWNLGEVFLSILIISYISYMGNKFQVKMKKHKERLKDKLILKFLYTGKANEPIDSIAESVIEWDWKFSSLNIFIINFELLPTILSTLMTYIIFIIQLKISETTNSPTSISISNSASKG